MPNEDFQDLLAAMPQIAEAINGFNSEAAQLKALDALFNAVRGDRSPVTVVTTALPSQAPSPEYSPADRQLQAPSVPLALSPPPAGIVTFTPKEEPQTKKSRRNGGKKNFSPVRHLNFAPDSKQALDDFIAEKQPRTIFEKNLVACYYLQEIMEVTGITVGHVLAVYQACSWSAPSQPDVSLRKTASSQGWIDTSEGNDLTLQWKGQNYVESKMPSPDPKRGRA